MLLPNLVNKTSFHEFTLTFNLKAIVSIFWLAVLGEGSKPGIWPEPRELPKRSLRHGTAAREQRLIAPQNMHAVERYGLKFANEKEAGRPVSSCSARRELRRRTGEPYVPLDEEHDGRYQMRDSRCVRRELRLCCTGRESPVRRRVRSMTPTTNVGLTRCDRRELRLCFTRRESPVRH